ncbi:MAG: IclR family transcriptional regulator [Natronomonas sp.]|nr:IclR family transcriptional regulator [Natronomonas sp.]
MVTNDPSKTLRTTATSIAVLELLEEIDGARVSEIAERMDRPKSTIHGHLTTLREKQFVIKEADFYFLGPELLRLGNKVRTRKPGFVLARQFAERLFEEAGLRSNFAVEMAGKAVFLHTASGEKMGWAHEQLGNRLFLHNTAVGKAILAEFPDMLIEQIIERWGLPRETESTITDREALFEEIAQIRERGYAINRAENFRELYAVGVAARRRPGDVVGGFSVAGPAHAVVEGDREDELARTVKELVSEFELELALA